MTPEERNTVIEALEVSLSLIDQIDFETGTIVAAALAIMRRDAPRIVYVRDDKGRIIGLQKVE